MAKKAEVPTGPKQTGLFGIEFVDVMIGWVICAIFFGATEEVGCLVEDS